MLENLKSTHSICQKALENDLEAQELVYSLLKNPSSKHLQADKFFLSVQKKDFSKES